jgi:hypothetical protein
MPQAASRLAADLQKTAMQAEQTTYLLNIQVFKATHKYTGR